MFCLIAGSIHLHVVGSGYAGVGAELRVHRHLQLALQTVEGSDAGGGVQRLAQRREHRDAGAGLFFAQHPQLFLGFAQQSLHLVVPGLELAQFDGQTALVLLGHLQQAVHLFVFGQQLKIHLCYKCRYDVMLLLLTLATFISVS